MSSPELNRTDVANCYRLVLGREPESEEVIEEKLRHPKRAILRDFFSSDECLENVLGPLAATGQVGAGAFPLTQSPELKAWGSRFMPLSPDGRVAFRRARHWPALFASLLDDQRFVDEIAPTGLRGFACKALVTAIQARMHSSLQGWVEWIDADVARGWAVDLNAPDRRLDLELIVNGEIVGAGTAGIYRSDLQARFGGEGRLGFVILRPAAVLRRRPSRHPTPRRSQPT